MVPAAAGGALVCVRVGVLSCSFLKRLFVPISPEVSDAFPFSLSRLFLSPLQQLATHHSS